MSSLNGLKIQRTTAAQQIAGALSEMIIRGELAPGAPLRESALAGELGVSRNTVREAVRILETGGLVQVEVGRGAVVMRLEPAEVAELYGVREMLEIAAVRDVKAPDLSGTRAALEELRGALQTGDEHDVVERDLAFHASLVAFHGNGRIDRFFADVCGELRFCLAVISHADREVERPDELVGQHEAVLTALQEGDRRRAASLLRAHIRANADRVTTLLQARQL